MFKATHKRRATTLSKTLLTAGLLGGAALSTLGAGSAQAVSGRLDCSFGLSTTHTKCFNDPDPTKVIDWTIGWTLEDKTLKNFSFAPGTPAGGPPSGDFSFIYDDFGAPGLSVEDMWTTLAMFDPVLPPPSTGSYTYDLHVTAPGWRFNTVELDSIHAGSGQVVTKVVKDAIGSTIATLESVNGMPDGPDLISGTYINVTDSWELDPGTGSISAISNTYSQVPAPLPILGVGAVFGSIRKLRKFSSQLKTFSMG